MYVKTVMCMLLCGVATLSGVSCIPPTITALLQSDYTNAFLDAIREAEVLYPAIRGMALNISNATVTGLRHICNEVADVTAAYVVFGSTFHIGMMTSVGKQTSTPVLGYGLNQIGVSPKSLDSWYLQLDTSQQSMAQAVARLLRKGNWFSFSIIVEDKFNEQGFTQGFGAIMPNTTWTIEDNIQISSADTDTDIEYKMVEMLDNRSRVIILHCSASLSKRVFAVAEKKGYIGQGYAWLVTGISVDNYSEPRDYPTGLVVIRPQTGNDIIAEIIHDAVLHVAFVLTAFQRENVTMWNSFINNKSCYNDSSVDQKHAVQMLTSKLMTTVTTGQTGKFKFDKYFSRDGGKFEILNLVYDDNTNTTAWKTTGNINQDVISLQSVVWPGGTVAGPISAGPQKWRVVTLPVQPFVVEQQPVEGTKCVAMATCLKFQSNIKDKNVIDNIFVDYENGIMNASRPYEVMCCKGLSIDLLERLSKDLNFEYQMYIVADRKYGALVNGSWNGLVEELEKGNAQMAVAAFSITGSRSRVIDYSEPYFYSGFSMLTIEREKNIPLDAFTQPFHPLTWIMIFSCATVVVFAMALLEWNSPFGLNPWGRKRQKNYSVSSASTMVYAVLFGHTMSTKTPKSWPSKWLQNFWAGASIFIVSSYVANLAAYIAGNTEKISVSSIHDPKLLTLRVSGLDSSSSLNMLGKINLQLYQHVLKWPADTSQHGFDMLRNNTVDIFIDDTPVLDYTRAQDKQCKLQSIGQGFADDSYGIGLKKGSNGSWLKIQLSQKIIEYHMSGYIERLRYIHFGSSICTTTKEYSSELTQLGLNNLSGLFVMVVVTIGACALVLCLEHAVFRWFVPWVRNKPKSSTWKSLHMMFISQRLYRIINSDELVNPHHSAREMMTIMKSRQFTQLFQKSVKKSDRAKMTGKKRDLFDIVRTAHSIDKINKLAGAESNHSLKSEGQVSVEVDNEKQNPATDPMIRRDLSFYSNASYLADDVDFELHNNTVKAQSNNSQVSDIIHNNDIGNSGNGLSERHQNNLQAERNNTYTASKERDYKLFPIKDNRLKQNIARGATITHQRELDVDGLSKEELLIMWKSSELEHEKRLWELMQEKAKLEKKLATIQDTDQIYV